MSAELKVLIDWENTGDFSDSIDDITADIEKVSWQLGSRQLWQPIADESKCKITLKNDDGKYLPENSNSPLFGLLQPHRRIRILSRLNTTDTILWTGWIGSIDPKWVAGPYLFPVVITGIGLKMLLDSETVDLPIFENVTGDVIIDAVLDRVQPPPAAIGIGKLDDPTWGILDSTTFLSSKASYSDIETGITIIPVYGDQKPAGAMAIIKEITASEQGRFFVDREGKATWWNRHHLLLDNVDDETVDTQADGQFCPSKLKYEYGKSISNVISVTLAPRQTGGPSETLWELDSPITISPGDEARLDATLRKENGQFAGAISLAATPTFSSGSALVNVIPNGGVATIVINNASLTNPAVLIALTLTGVSSQSQNRMEIEAIDTESVAAYGHKQISVGLGTLSDYGQAVDVAEFELARRADPQGNIRELAYINKLYDGIQNAHMLEWTVGTRLRLIIDEFGQEHSYFVMGEKHEWKADNTHKTTFQLEPADRQQYLILDDASYGTLDNNRLAY